MRITLILAVGWLMASAQAVPVASVADARAELGRMFVTDQQYRNELAELSQEKGADHPEVGALWDKQLELDKRNLRVLERIIAVHGWPEISTFGQKAATAAFLIVQHADLSHQLKYLPLLRRAAEVGEARKGDLALLIDRVRMGQGKPQLYGSQLRQAPDGTLELYPIEDERRYAARRDGAGAARGLPSLFWYRLREPLTVRSLEPHLLGGVKQWLLISGNAQHPILLVLHGGPGGADIATASRYQRDLENHFLVVNWDQRGAGKSDGADLSVEQLVTDAAELIKLLLVRFGKEKLYLLGHSWGSALGLIVTQSVPELVHGYIGVGQLVDAA